MLGTGTTTSNCSTAYEYWSNGHYCEKLLEFFEPWQNFLYDANPSIVVNSNNLRPRVGGYRLIITFEDDDGNDTNMYPMVHDNVFLTGGVSFNQSEPDVQRIRLQLTFAIGNMKPTQVSVPTYTLTYHTGNNTTFTQTYPVTMDPVLAYSDGIGFISDKGYLKGWSFGNLNYRKGSIVPALRGISADLYGIYSHAQLTIMFGRDGAFSQYADTNLHRIGSSNVYMCNVIGGKTKAQIEAYDNPEDSSYFVEYSLGASTIYSDYRIAVNAPYDVSVWMVGGGGGGMFGPSSSTFAHGNIYSGGGGGSGYLTNPTKSYVTGSSTEELILHVGKGGGCAEAYKGFWGIQFYEDRCTNGADSILRIKTLYDSMKDETVAKGGKAGNVPIGRMVPASNGPASNASIYSSIAAGNGGNGQGKGGKGGYGIYNGGSSMTSYVSGENGENNVSSGGSKFNGSNYDYTSWGNGSNVGSAGGGSIPLRDGFVVSNVGTIVAKGGNGITSETDWPNNDKNASEGVTVNGIYGGGGGGGTPVVNWVTKWGGVNISDGIFDSGVTIGAGYGGGGVIIVQYFKNDGVTYAN